MSARLATVEDVPALVEMRSQLMEHFGWVRSSDPHDGAWLARLDDVLCTGIPAGTVVAAVVPNELGELVASGVATIVDHLPSPALPHGQYGYISSMFTQPDHRGRGFGRVVVQVLIDALRARGIARIELHAVDAVAERLYRDEGFVDRPGGIPMRFSPAGAVARD